MENYVKFKRGTAAAFEALTTKDSDTLYFITNEDGSISVYLGAKKAGVTEDELKELLSINDLADVDIEANDLVDGYVLTYDAQNHKWVSAVNPGASGAVGDLADRVDNIEDNYVTGEELTTAVTTINTNLTTNFYTKTETNTAIATAVSQAGHLKREVVNTLPAVGDAAEDVIYLLLDADDVAGNKYDEYMLVNGAFERLGDWEVDLSNYVTTSQLDAAVDRIEEVEDKATSNDENISRLNGEVDTLKNAGYVNGGEVDTKITTALTDYVSSTQLTETLKGYALKTDLDNNYVTTTVYNGKVEDIEDRLDTIEGALTWVELTV